MKRGDLIHYMWQHGTGSNIHGGLCYELRDGKTLCLNDLRAIWEYLNADIPYIETTVKGYVPESERKLNRVVKDDVEND